MLKRVVVDLQNHLFIKVIIFIIFVLPAFNVSGQYTQDNLDRFSIRYGIKQSGGIIMARKEATDVGSINDLVFHRIELAETLPQFSTGLFRRQRFGWLFLDISTMYNTFGMRYNTTTFTTEGQPEQRMAERFHYINNQVIGGLISNDFRFYVGPIMHILVKQDTELTKLENYLQKIRRISYGFSFGIGYDIDRFSFDIKYDKAFRTIGDHLFYKYKRTKLYETPDGLTITVSYTFSKEYVR